jgi:hypothetical protein
MKYFCYLVVGFLIVAGVCSLVTAAGAAESTTFGFPAFSSSGTTPGSETDSIHRFGTIKYYVVDGTGVHRHTLGETNTINIVEFNSLILQVPALVSGPANQRGAVAVVRVESNVVTHLLLLKPGKGGTLKTQSPPIRYIMDGTYTLGVVVVAPNGGSTARTITVNVAPMP